MSDTLFALADAGARYTGRAVLADVTLTIRAGEKVALVGESGAGKSTLLALLRAQRPADVAWCPQQHGLVPVLSVFHNVYMGALDRHSTPYNLVNLVKPRPREIAAVTQVADRLGIGDKLWTSVDRLSGGQQQRTAIGRALFAEKSIFLGDEPVSAVDAFQARAILADIAAMHATMVVALHDIDLALACCDRVIGLHDGRIVLDAATGALTAEDLAPLYPRGPHAPA